MPYITRKYQIKKYNVLSGYTYTDDTLKLLKVSS